MIKIFSKFKIIFYLINFFFDFFVYLSRKFNGPYDIWRQKNTTTNNSRFCYFIESLLHFYCHFNNWFFELQDTKTDYLCHDLFNHYIDTP